MVVPIVIGIREESFKLGYAIIDMYKHKKTLFVVSFLQQPIKYYLQGCRNGPNRPDSGPASIFQTNKVDATQ